MNLKDTYNRIAEDWVKNHKTDDWWVEGTDLFIKHLSKGGHVLDVGCAGGVKSKYLIERGLLVTGIDLSEKMIEIAKHEVPEAKFIAMDLKEISALDGMFDGIFLQAVLLHIPKADAQACIETLAQKIKAGGLFYIAVKAKRDGGAKKSGGLLQDLAGYPLELANKGIVKVDSAGRVDEEIKVENDYGYEYQRFFSYYTPAELKGYFENMGFEIVYENGAALTHTNWIQVIGRKL